MNRWARASVLLLVLVAGLNGLAWSAVVPPLFAPDELQHFLYAHDLAHSGQLRVEPDHTLTRELVTLADLSGYRWTELEASRWVPQWDSGRRREYQRSMEAQVESPRRMLDDQKRYLGHPVFNRYHPPLYPALVGSLQLTMRERTVLTRLQVSRLFSVSLGVGTVLLSLLLGRLLWPDRPAFGPALGLMVATLPLQVFTSSVVSNLALEITLMTGVLYSLARVLQEGWSGRRLLVLGLLTAAGLLTRASFLTVFLLLGLMLVLVRRGPSLAKRSAALLLAPLLLASWWYVPLLTGVANGVVAYYHHVPYNPDYEAPPNLPAQEYLRSFNWERWSYAMFDDYWGASLGPGTRVMADPKVPRGLRLLQSLAAVVALVTVLLWFWRGLRGPSPDRPRALILLLLGLATVGYAVFFQALDYYVVRNPGEYFWFRGQYFLPAVAGQMAWLLFGWSLLLGRWAAPLMGALWAGTNLFTLLGVVLPRYYAPGSLGEQLGKASDLAILPPAGLEAVCGGLVLASGLLVVCLTVLARKSPP